MTRTDELKSRIKSVMVSLPNRAALDQLCTLYDAEITRLTWAVAERDADIAEAVELLKRIVGPPLASNSGGGVKTYHMTALDADVRRARDFIGRMGK